MNDSKLIALLVVPLFRRTKHCPGGQFHNFVVAPDVDRQTEASMFIDSLCNGCLESYLCLLFNGQLLDGFRKLPHIRL